MEKKDILQSSVKEEDSLPETEEREEDGIITETNEIKEEDNLLIEIDSLKKHEAAVVLVDKTKQIIETTEKQLNACKLLLEDDIKNYKEAKASLKQNALNESQNLLKDLAYTLDEDEIKEDDTLFDTEDNVPPFLLKEVSSGKISATMLSLVTGGITFAGLILYAKEKSGIALDFSVLPDIDTCKEIIAWYGTVVGNTPDFIKGGAIVAGGTLLVMGITYMIRIMTRANKNLHFAKEQLEEAQRYAKQKGNCQTEMEKVDEHIHDAIDTLKRYEIVLEEQNAKLKRIKFIEGVRENEEYHENSLKEMHDTTILLRAISQFIATPMSEAGKLSGKSTLFLHSAKSKLQKVLDRFYGN